MKDYIYLLYKNIDFCEGNTCNNIPTSLFTDVRSKNLEESLKTKGSLYLRNRDVNGKKLLVFDVKKHTKGVNNMADMQRMFLYFLERVDREDSDGMVTIGNERANNHKHFRKK